jgi:hypothetical protein
MSMGTPEPARAGLQDLERNPTREIRARIRRRANRLAALEYLAMVETIERELKAGTLKLWQIDTWEHPHSLSERAVSAEALPPGRGAA